jgi:prepilin-type N-terminal cleavage/methylation domain-containing protein
MKRARGFTLVELVVAIALMALMALLCWRAIGFVAERRAAAEGDTLELTRLLRTFAQIERDVDERLPDIASPARATAPELPLALALAPAALGIELEVLRASDDGAGAPRVLPVVYRVSAEGLVRRTPGAEVVLLPKAARLGARIFAGGFWLEPGEPQRVRPPARAAALELSIIDAAGVRYVKVLPL